MAGFEPRAGSHPFTAQKTVGWCWPAEAATMQGLPERSRGWSRQQRGLCLLDLQRPSRGLPGWPSLSVLLSASAHQSLVQRTGQVSQQICCMRHHYLPGQRRRLREAQRRPGFRVIGPFRSKLSAAGNKTLPFNSGIIRSGLETSRGKAFIEK